MVQRPRDDAGALVDVENAVSQPSTLTETFDHPDRIRQGCSRNWPPRPESFRSPRESGEFVRIHSEAGGMNEHR